MQQKVQKSNEEVALLKAENDRLTLLLEESKNWKHDMESQLKKSKGQVYFVFPGMSCLVLSCLVKCSLGLT